MGKKNMEITEEQAIEILQAYCEILIKSVSNQLYGDIQAFNMAIQALQDEYEFDHISCQKCKYFVPDEMFDSETDEEYDASYYGLRGDKV